MGEKKRYLQVERPLAGGCYYIVDDPGIVETEARISLEEYEPGEQLIVTVVEMTEDEYDDLPEFGGW